MFRLPTNVQERTPKAKGTHVYYSQMCACLENFAYSSEKCVGFHNEIINYIKYGSLNTKVLQRQVVPIISPIVKRQWTPCLVPS